jgi:hypothetical protein
MDPDAYAPQYGGYCAYAMTMGHLVPSQPEAFTLYRNRLYLTESFEVRDLWRQDIAPHVAVADENWSRVAPR